MGRRVADRLPPAGALAAVAGLLVLAPAGTAVAQARYEVIPSVAVTELYSDDVDRLPGGSRGGFTTNVTPRLRAARLDARLSGVLDYALNFRIEHFDEGDRDIDHEASLAAHYVVNPRWRLSLRDELRISPDPTQSLVFVTPEGRYFPTFEEAIETPGVDVLDLRAVRVREDETRNRLTVGTTYLLTPRWSTGADVEWTVQDARANVFRDDSETLEGRVRATYRLTPVDDVGVAIRAEQVDFGRSPDAQILRAQAEWQRRLLETLRLALIGGYAIVSTEDDDALGGRAEDESEYYVRGALRGRTEDGRWQVELSRDVASNEGIGDITERRAVEASISRRLGRLLSGDVRAAYLQSRSVRGFGGDVDVFAATAAASYRLVRWARLRAAYRYRRDEPAGGGPAADENQVLLGLEVLWPLRELPGIRSDF